MARYALTDIHGCLKTFKTMVEEVVRLQPTDHLYLLGDYINKGPDSKGVLDYILRLQREGFQLTCLRGNHDQLLLDAVDKGEQAVWLPGDDKARTLENFGVPSFSAIPEIYQSFVRNLPLLVVLEDYVLVHAGLNFSDPNLLATDNHTLMNTKHQQPTAKKMGHRLLVHGHVPVTRKTIERMCHKPKGAIDLDAGCVYYKNSAFGEMCAFNLDTRQLHWLTNQDAPYPIKVKD